MVEENAVAKIIVLGKEKRTLIVVDVKLTLDLYCLKRINIWKSFKWSPIKIIQFRRQSMKQNFQKCYACGSSAASIDVKCRSCLSSFHSPICSPKFGGKNTEVGRHSKMDNIGLPILTDKKFINSCI